MKTCRSDIYMCETCNAALEYAVDEDGECLDDSPSVCVADQIVYRVDMETGELWRTDERVPDGWGASEISC